jgi:hypothetical protein
MNSTMKKMIAKSIESPESAKANKAKTLLKNHF